MENRRISWDDEGIVQFNKAILHIAEDSIQNAESVMADVLDTVESLASRPEKFPPDKFKVNNDGSYRAFELHRLRVAYYVGDDVVRILRVRHTSREPKSY